MQSFKMENMENERKNETLIFRDDRYFENRMVRNLKFSGNEIFCW